MIDIESDSEPGDYDFFEKYDEHGDALQTRPKYLGKQEKYPFDIPEASGKINPGMLKSIDASQIGRETDWVKCKLQMQAQINNPARHSQMVNEMITQTQKEIKEANDKATVEYVASSVQQRLH